ncbi:response regulator [Massilia sp. H6]|uniref:response regulator n=1 Tax=Massilia sp. H6 TaxID=2970464 RepID=UPI00216A5969|nr:response regulator [Massilia sp. H6]UVW29916.1 response regulator [Massilia sp. H6]
MDNVNAQVAKVLVVDDDVVSRMMLMHLVDRCGQVDLVEAEDGEDAWRRLAGGLRPAIVFCDLRMPRLSGMELLARVRADAALAALPFVLVSAASDAATLDQAGRLGADGYIVKPFALEQVRAQFEQVLGAGGARDEAPEAVARRLAIAPERLLVYLAGLQRQLGEAARMESGAPLLRLAEGCATLGLASSAQELRAAAGQHRPDAVQAALGHALAAARRQQERVGAS